MLENAKGHCKSLAPLLVAFNVSWWKKNTDVSENLAYQVVPSKHLQKCTIQPV